MLSSKISDIKNAKYNKKLVKSFGIGCTFLLKYTSEGGGKTWKSKVQSSVRQYGMCAQTCQIIMGNRNLPSASRCFHPCAAYAKNSLFRAEVLRRKIPSLPI